MDKSEFRELQSLLEPCQTPEELDKFLIKWIGISLPWDTVDENSTSSPLKLIWQVNNVFLTNEGPTQHIVMASRNSYKTVDAALIQFISMLHYRRDGAHIASIMEQSLTTIRYIDQYMGIPLLHQFRKIDNVRLKQFINLPPNDASERPEAILRVITATKRGANSPRASTLTLDEVDLTPQSILDEVAFVADPTRGKRFKPVYVYLSSRKTNNGPIQTLSTKAEKQKDDPKKRLKLHKWSHADMLVKCPPEIHKPELGSQVAYIHSDSLEVIWGAESFDKQVTQSNKSNYQIIEAFEGCKDCAAFIACRGFSAKQRAETDCLRERDFIGDLLGAIQDPGVISAQSLNWKPESGGLVYKTFKRYKHVSDKVDFYRWVTGSYFRAEELGITDEEIQRIEEEGSAAQIATITPTKIDIYNAMVKGGWKIVAGTDFGFHPDPACCVVAGYHKKTRRVGVLLTVHANYYANKDWASYLEQEIFQVIQPDWIGPDLEDAASPTYFRKISALTTKPHRIITGVSHLRGLLWNPVTQSSGLMILDDSDEYPIGTFNTAVVGREPGNGMIISAFERHQHAKAPGLGTWVADKFADDGFKHSLDALRYALAPLVEEGEIVLDFGNSAYASGSGDSALLAAAQRGDKAAKQQIEQRNNIQNTMKDFFQDTYGIDRSQVALSPPDSMGANQNATAAAVVKRKIKWSF